MDLNQAAEEVINGFKTVDRNWTNGKFSELMQQYAEFRKLDAKLIAQAMKLAADTQLLTRCTDETAIRWALLQYALKLGLTITK